MGGERWEDKRLSLHLGLLLKQESLLSKVISGGQWTPSLSPPQQVIGKVKRQEDPGTETAPL